MRIETERVKQSRSIQTREKIISSGTTLFCRDGYFSTSAKKISKHAGVATGTFYLYFSDKKELLLEIHRRHAESVHDAIEHFLKKEFRTHNENADGLSFMQKLVKLVYETHKLSPELHREITILSLTDPCFAEMDLTEKKLAIKKINDCLNPYVSKLRVKDIEAANILVSLSIEAVIHNLIMTEPSISKQRLFDALADMLNSYLFSSQ